MCLLELVLSPSLDIIAVIVLVRSMYSVLIPFVVASVMVRTEVNGKSILFGCFMAAAPVYVMSFQILVIFWPGLESGAQKALAFLLVKS